MLWPGTLWALNGDIQGDGELDVSDVQCMVLAVLDLTPNDPATDPGCMASDAESDLDCSDELNVVDVQLLVQMVLGGLIGTAAMPASVDGDADNIHDSCDSCPVIWNPEQTTYLDNCGDCVGGNSGNQACQEDCAGEWGGEAYLDNCDKCVGGSSGNQEVSDGDCDGISLADDCDDSDSSNQKICGATDDLMISEFYRSGNGQFDYIELYNSGNADIDLGGWHFERNPHPTKVVLTAYIWLGGVVPAGGTYIISQTAPDFESHVGSPPDAYHPGIQLDGDNVFYLVYGSETQNGGNCHDRFDEGNLTGPGAAHRLVATASCTFESSSWSGGNPSPWVHPSIGECTDGLSGCDVSPAPGSTSVRDYGYLFWPTNHWYQFSVYNEERYIQTGYYGLALDVSVADFVNLGLINDESSPEQALHQHNNVITGLPTAAVSYFVTHEGAERVANGFFGTGGAVSNPSRLIDMGRFMQRVDIPEVTYADAPELTGSVQLAAMTRHFVLTHRAKSVQGGSITVSIEFSGDAITQFDETEWLDGVRAVSVHDGAGQGWSFIIAGQPGATPQISRSADGALMFQNTYGPTTGGQEVTLSVIAVPSNAGNDEQLSVWLNPKETVTVEYSQLNRDGSGGENLTEASWDAERGLYLVGLHNLSEVGAGGSPNWADPTIHNWYNRHRIVIQNNNSGPVSVPLAFDGGGNAAFYITGGSPLLRDTQGEPIGAPIQISKNWHDPPAWYHLYSALQLGPGTHEFEHTFAHSMWGNAYAAAHAQLSLIGWGMNQQWDESSLGAFGESITYDPDMTLNRSMVDDVRPFLVQTANKWGWTGNVGGAAFLVYSGEGTGNRPEHQLGRLRSYYAYTGPNLTDVVYAGVTRDGKISARIATQLGRTDDLVRVYYHLRYTFHEDVTYDRLALFQMASDRYGDNGFTRYAYGNASEVVFDEAVPAHNTTGYASTADRGISLDGDAPWVMLYDSTHTSGNLPEHLANVAFVVRDYKAKLGDTEVTTPHINIVRTNNGGWSQMSFELGVPYDAENRVIPAGSVITATVEYLVPPADKSAYYGGSDYLLEMPAASYQSTNMALALAAGNQLEVLPFVGTLARTYPLEFSASPGPTAVRFTLTGGLGYTPLTIRGLARPDGWRLEQRVGSAWELVDQAVEGNDYWQANDDAATGTFDLIFNVHNRGTHQYRLVRGTAP